MPVLCSYWQSFRRRVVWCRLVFISLWGGGILSETKSIFWTHKNGIYNFNALRSSNLPTYIIDDKFYLEHTKVVLNRLWGSERGIYGLEIHYAAHKRYLSYTSVTLWEALKSVFGIRAKGFILWGIKRQYRGRRAAVFAFITERVYYGGINLLFIPDKV